MREQTEEYQKLNAFSRRPCATQIVSYVVVLAVNLIFWLLIQNKFVSQGRRFAMIVLFSMSLVVLLVVGFITSYLDPSDPVLKQQFNSKKPMKQLWVDVVSVIIWTGTFTVSIVGRMCLRLLVTASNVTDVQLDLIITVYGQIVASVMIWAAFTHLFLFLLSLALLWSQNNWEMYMAEIIVSWFVGLVVLIFVIMIVGLICLHTFLMCNNMTTFDYILSKKTVQERKKFNNVIKVKLQDLKEKEPDCPAEKQREGNNENFKTQNEIPLPSAFQQINQILDQQKSDFPSLQCFKQPNKSSNSNNLKAVSPQNFESILFEKIEEQSNLVRLYRSNRSLKILVGNSIEVRERRGSVNGLSPRSQHSRKSSIKLSVYKPSELVNCGKNNERKVHSQVI